MADPDLLLHFEDETPLAQDLAREMKVECVCLGRHTFPDGELKITLPPTLPPRVGILRSLHHPNTKLIELLLSAQTARTLGADVLTLIAPYMAYMRQDKAFHPGEAVSQAIVGPWLATLFDTVITIDPHLHRVSHLSEAIPAQRAVALTAAPLLGAWIHKQCPQALLIGPDEESLQWVREAAQAQGMAYAVCRKVRHGDRQVSIALPSIDVKDRTVVLLDDVASSGQTLIQAARLLLEAGARSVDAAVTHALFSGPALEQVQASGIRYVWSTNAIAHSSNAINIAALLAQAAQVP